MKKEKKENIILRIFFKMNLENFKISENFKFKFQKFKNQISSYL